MLPYRHAARAGTEFETLRGVLDENRSIMLWKLDGITDEQLRWSPVPSGTSLGGIVKHLARVELWWFCDAFAGRAAAWAGQRPWSQDDPGSEWRLDPGDGLATVRELYAGAVAEADELLDEADDLDARCALPGQEHRSLRWVLAHMIEETARHAGHADILRELLDGATGYLPE